MVFILERSDIRFNLKNNININENMTYKICDSKRGEKSPELSVFKKAYSLLEVISYSSHKQSSVWIDTTEELEINPIKSCHFGLPNQLKSQLKI